MQFSDLPDRVAEIRGRIAAAHRRGGHSGDVRIVAVTKTHGPDAVLAAMSAGLTDIGENKVQEALGKQEAIAARSAMTGGIPAVRATPAEGQPAGLQWHLIGHLQRNKVKHLDRFTLFHAVDSTRLADAIIEQGRTSGRTIDVLVEVNVSGEESKGGFAVGEIEREATRLAEVARTDAERAGRSGAGGMRVVGVMTMAPLGADEGTLRKVFAGAREAGAVFRAAGHPATELSMGMSGDYEVAVEEGATMVRLGTVLFGERGR
jgi:pyridoxal phosphate enzyme (YggS family)